MIPIRITEGIELVETERKGIAKARVINQHSKEDLSWDRFVRLNAVAELIRVRHPVTKKILDVGGFDGALAFFLPDHDIEILDPATTGGSILSMPADDREYDLVVAIDLLEHIEPKSRNKALEELARACKNHLILNYPRQESKDSQKLVLELTQNSLIKEHVEWELPNTAKVLETLHLFGFRGSHQSHTSIATWMGQYLLLNFLPEQSKPFNRHLNKYFTEESSTAYLYDLVSCERFS